MPQPGESPFRPEIDLEPGNRLQLLSRGATTRKAMLAAIGGAQRRVWLESFMLVPDRTGRAFIRALAEAAGRGVETVLIVDHVGSIVFSLGFQRKLRRAGVRVVIFNPLPLWRRYGRRVGGIRERDHRKILIADDVGFCGGHNLTNSYLGRQKAAHYDFTLRIEGPVVAPLAAVFVQTLAQATDWRPGPGPTPAPLPGGALAGVALMDRRNGIDSADGALLAMLRTARTRCFMMFAYFVPERWLVDAMKAAASRGVDVRLMVAGKTDIPPARAAGRDLYDELLASGVTVLELQDQRLHAKLAVADERSVILGSFDYNRLSAEYSLEVSIVAEDAALGALLDAAFRANAERARMIGEGEWRDRPLGAKVVQGLARRMFDLASGRSSWGRNS